MMTDCKGEVMSREQKCENEIFISFAPIIMSERSLLTKLSDYVEDNKRTIIIASAISTSAVIIATTSYLILRSNKPTKTDKKRKPKTKTRKEDDAASTASEITPADVALMTQEVITRSPPIKLYSSYYRNASNLHFHSSNQATRPTQQSNSKKPSVSTLKQFSAKSRQYFTPTERPVRLFLFSYHYIFIQ